MIINGIFKNAMTTTLQVENGIAAVAIVHTPESGYPPAVFEMHIDKIDEFYTLCRQQSRQET